MTKGLGHNASERFCCEQNTSLILMSVALWEKHSVHAVHASHCNHGAREGDTDEGGSWLVYTWLGVITEVPGRGCVDHREVFITGRASGLAELMSALKPVGSEGWCPGVLSLVLPVTVAVLVLATDSVVD